ncbi:MAG: hypothetical protein WDN75_10725 [Bacteroidota bacterium]
MIGVEKTTWNTGFPLVGFGPATVIVGVGGVVQKTIAWLEHHFLLLKRLLM